MNPTGRLVAWLVLATCLTLSTGTGALTYSEVTDEAGIDFQTAGEVHAQGTSDWPAFPEIMGSGACIADFDGDGYDDIYLVNQRYNENNPATEGWIDDVDPRNELYINQGDGTFDARGALAGVDSDAFGYGCSAADYDGDGDVDLFVANFGTNELYENRGNGTFANVTATAGVAGDACGTHRCMSTSSAWADYDDDGDLDLYVGNYVDTTLMDSERGPRGHEGQHNFLYENQGDGTFAEVADQEGVAGHAGDVEGSKTLGVTWLDTDQDGDLDLYVANDQTENDYYENVGGTFEERSYEANLADSRAGMGVTAQDYDADGYPDLFFTHYEFQTNGFYWNRGDGSFEDRSGEDEQDESLPMVGWGAGFVDADRDGDLDILVANGHTEWKDRDYDQNFQAFRQDPDPSTADKDKQWTDATASWGLEEVEEKVTRGLALGDLDLDGDTDMVAVNNANQTAQVLEASGVDDHHLTVALTHAGADPDGIGARVAVTVNGSTTYQTLRAGSSYLSQNSLKAGFGLGNATTADEVTVRWPDGATTTLADVPGDQVIRVNRSTGDYVNDTIAPTSAVEVEGTPGENGWWVSPVNVTVGAEDRGVTHVSGVDEVQMAIGDEAWRAPETTRLEEGVHRVHHRATDNASNTAPRATALVRVDLTAPTAEADLAGTRGEDGWWVGADVTVQLEAADALSGVDRIEASLDGGPWRATNGNLTVSEPGVTEVRFRAVDRAGLVSEEGSLEVKLDPTPPAVELVRPASGEFYLGEDRYASTGTGPAAIVLLPSPLQPDTVHVTVRAEAADATSGIQAVDLFVDGELLGSRTHDGPYAWAWPVSEYETGMHEVLVAAEDVAGNGAIESLDVLVGNARPSVP